MTLAAKSLLRGGRPIIIAPSTNDGLSGSAPALGQLLQTAAAGWGKSTPITVPELAALAQRKLAALCNAPDTGAAVQVKFADAGKPVHRLAVISGAGGSLFAEAIAEGADCLLTGEAYI